MQQGLQRKMMRELTDCIYIETLLALITVQVHAAGATAAETTVHARTFSTPKCALVALFFCVLAICVSEANE